MPAQERNRRAAVVRLDDLSSMVVAVEHMVGFRPSDSLVAVALSGPRERMSFSLRLDLPTGEDDHAMTAAIAAEVAKRMAVADADAVMLFVYTACAPDDGALPFSNLVDAVVAELDAPLREATLVAGERLWSYVCDDERCCPREGQPVDRQSTAALTLAAEHAALGNVVLASREELLDSVRPIGGITALSMREAQDRALASMLDAGVVVFAAEVEKEIDALVDRFTDPRAHLDDEEAARVAVGLTDKVLRDVLLVRLTDADDEALRRLVSAVARRTQPPDDAPICTLLGFASYVDGGGLVASAALERALRSDPDYVLARYLLVMLQHQVSPDEVRSCGAAIATDVARPGRSRRRRR